MKEDRLEHMERRLRMQGTPAAPGSLEQNVLRSIRQRGNRESPWQLALAELLLNVRVAMPLLAAAALLGGAFGAGVIAETSKPEPTVSQALGFDSITDSSQFELLATR